MSEELPVISGELTEKGVLIYDQNERSLLQSKGYGEETEKALILKDYEATYLLYNKFLKLKKDGDEITIEKYVDHIISKDTSAWTRFLVYRDLRSRGYIVREGFGFGVDFRVYERGEYATKPAKYVVIGLNEGTKRPISNLNETVNQIKKMGKEAVIAVIESRGEVIYYKIRSWMPYHD